MEVEGSGNFSESPSPPPDAGRQRQTGRRTCVSASDQNRKDVCKVREDAITFQHGCRTVPESGDRPPEVRSTHPKDTATQKDGAKRSASTSNWHAIAGARARVASIHLSIAADDKRWLVARSRNIDLQDARDLPGGSARCADGLRPHSGSVLDPHDIVPPRNEIGLRRRFLHQHQDRDRRGAP